ncbi:unnamed protein product [Symbiodinium natans]|uniref:Uncharacterized protein n=1 Tax=Symbiodinium natans TaxID=878477 RepID=A0A812TVI4_9DINO|nr:unnamed protein product [Symbiodinium natans]
MNGKADLQRQLAETRGFPAINKATIMQMLQVVLCSELPMVTVATFNRQQLPTLALANNPFVASRFHTVMGRFSAVGPEPQDPEVDRSEATSSETSSPLNTAAAPNLPTSEKALAGPQPVPEPSAPKPPAAEPAATKKASNPPTGGKLLKKFQDIMAVSHL